MTTNPVRQPHGETLRPPLTDFERRMPQRFTLLTSGITVEPFADLPAACARIHELRARRGLSVRRSRAVLADTDTFETFGFFAGPDDEWIANITLPHAQEAALQDALRAAAPARKAAA